MPTYVYRCEQCSHHLEVIQKFSDAPLTVCPRCQGELRRVIHSTGIVFKGSGWYITDSRKNSSDEGKPAKPASTDSKAESKSETTPAAPNAAD